MWKAIDKKTREVVALKKVFDAFQNATGLIHYCLCYLKNSLTDKSADAQRTFREIMFLQVGFGLTLKEMKTKFDYVCRN